MDIEYLIKRLKFYLKELSTTIKIDSYLFTTSENDKIQRKIDELEQFLVKEYNSKKSK